MEYSRLPMKNQLELYLILIVTSYCSFKDINALENCVDADSLVVEKWTSMFLFQCISGSLG